MVLEGEREAIRCLVTEPRDTELPRSPRQLDNGPRGAALLDAPSWKGPRLQPRLWGDQLLHQIRARPAAV